jgi:hypothetical protein
MLKGVEAIIAKYSRFRMPIDTKNAAMTARLSFCESKFFHSVCKIQKNWRASKIQCSFANFLMTAIRINYPSLIFYDDGFDTSKSVNQIWITQPPAHSGTSDRFQSDYEVIVSKEVERTPGFDDSAVRLAHGK